MLDTWLKTLYIQLFREREGKNVGKNVQATISQSNMGYDQYIVPDTVVV